LLHAVIAARHGTATPVVCVLGASRSSTADAVGAGLVATAHRLGLGVLLVSGDWPQGWTEADVLKPHAVSERLAWRRISPELASLAVLPFGEAAETEELVLSPAMAPFVDGARTNRDLVVLCGGSSTNAISRRFATLADLTVIAVELGVDQFDEVVDTVESLRESGVENIGLVAAFTARRRP
jgi:Mrp family chromosome partitioning ATPase